MAVAAPSLVYEGLPQPALLELQQIHEAESGIRPDRVVEVASDPANPLHAHFEWDDSQAAHQHRIAQARQLIARVKVFVAERPEVRVRAYVSIGADHGREYRKMTDVLSSPITFDQLRRSIQMDLVKLQRKMARFDEFAEVAAALQEVVEQLS